MLYSESGPDSNFPINSASNVDYSSPESNFESESESDFSSVFMNLDIIFFILYLHSSKQI